ncbi:Hypp2819 [Branchiostoma lanceolatum]|uniref:Mitochondria-eating protein n=1 Tax=Branchiostoma lanceolatum TaxID=7740 RepID=A0A8J9ZUU8_BRALA|nr:Hypp2819 [Branchiostoma lanceolatum]
MDDDIAINELSLENISPRSRPSNLAIRYQELETVEWLAAKEELDSAHSSGKELVTQYLCDVFVVMAAGQLSNKSVELPGMQQDLQRKAKDIIKERSDKCNIDDIIKRVEECMRNKEQYLSHIGTMPSDRKSLETYISECCRLAWRMNVQTPAMAVSVETDVPFDPALHERAYDC